MFTKFSPVSLARSPRSPLLKPHSENLILDIRSTESSANYILDADILASQQSRYLVCSFCKRLLQSKAGLTNHEKSHIREQLKQKRLERYKKLKKDRIYTCKECGEEFAQRGLLNKHAKTHINVIECNICHKTFKDRMEFEIHDAINDGKNYESLNFPACRTRSQSRLSCHGVSQTVRSVSCDAAFYNGYRTPLSVFGNETNASSSRKRGPRSTSRLSMLSMSSHNLPKKKSKSVSDWIENNAYLPIDDFSDTSSIRSLNSDRGVSPASSTWDSTYTEATFVQNRFICSETNCMKMFPSLNWVTTHEMVEHKKLALYRCKECRKRFTTSGNLRQHRIHFHSDLLICVLCDIPQNGIAAIEEHLELHQKYSVKCDVCSKLFLSKHYLDQHLKYKVHRHKNHRQTKGTILIRVDRRETRDFLDLDESSSKLPVKLKTCDYDDYNFSTSEDNRVDDLPWRS